MKTLASRIDANEIERRVELLTEHDPRRWGKMTARQMVCHLCDAYAIALGRLPAEKMRSPMPPGVLKWAALYAPTPWPKNLKTLPELELPDGAPSTDSFVTDKASLIDTFWQFVGATGERPDHAIFGPMTPADWLRWGYLHADHHLRQFGR